MPSATTTELSELDRIHGSLVVNKELHHEKLTIIETVKELFELYRIRDEVNFQIRSLEERVNSAEVASRKVSRKKKRKMPSRGLQQPTTDILGLFGDNDVMTRNEVLERSKSTYKDKYTPASVTSSLWRLNNKYKLLEYDGTYYYRPQAKSEAVKKAKK